MKPLLHLDYPLDKSLLWEIANGVRDQSSYYIDPRINKIITNWKIIKHTAPYIEKIIHDFGVGGSPRFYWLAPNTKLGTHVDNGTTCSINLILNENPAPVTMSDIDMFYNQALLNTTVPHSVTNGPEERVLLKISIFDKTFEEVSEIINYKKSNDNTFNK
jgi:hypothetical protein